MSVQLAHVELGPATWLGRLNTSRHQVATYLFTAVVLAHWAEHVVQAVQIWSLGWPRPEALGLLGLAVPGLISEEWLHWGYAVVMLVGFVVLLPGMTGRARFWWKVALWIQVWHWVEHLLLFVQAQLDVNFFGASGPTSIAQLVVPRVELHLFYNAIVTAPMVWAMIEHLWPKTDDPVATCSCSRR